ncbi:uncharacterized protein [Eurosta solidaginis]|uniref:uncharacterized protein n=1 Tax=Eurosta solidaginis TaxID=178769 RepID=UPI0035317C2D
METWSRVSLLLVVFIATITGEVKLTDANVLFRFSLGVRVGNNDSTETIGGDDVFNKTIIFDNNRLTIRNNLDPNDMYEETVGTEAPYYSKLPSSTTTVQPVLSADDFRMEEQRKMEKKLMEIYEALTQLLQEITIIDGRSEYLEQKLKIIISYVNFFAQPAAKGFKSQNPNDNANLTCYRSFIEFVEKLDEPVVGLKMSEQVKDYYLLKSLLEKYKIFQLKEDVDEQMHAASEAWKQYVAKKVVKVDV